MTFSLHDLQDFLKQSAENQTVSTGKQKKEHEKMKYKTGTESLLRQEWDGNLLCMAFSVHDLQRDFLKQSAENQTVSTGKQKGTLTKR